MPRKRASRKSVFMCSSCGYEPAPSSGPVNFCPHCGTALRGGASAASTTSTFVHRVVAERYRLISVLGEGGMGAVYKAEHIRMGKTLALKILRGDFAREPGAVERFLAEARIVSRLSHPHTIAVFDFGEIDGAGAGFYLAMEYVPGKDLASVLRESGALPERRVAEIGQQLLGSLAEAHDAGIVHRDVKPGNVMLMQTRSGEDFVKVLDFGIATLRHPGPEPAASPSTTSAGALVGTPSYVAPEQARGGAVDARSDLYAVGCLLYELASGRPPFVAPSAMAVVAAQLHQDPPPLADAAGVSQRFAEVIHRALRKRPEERFATADAMREALGAASEPTGSRALARERASDLAGGLRIASREDFAELDRDVRTLRRVRVLAPAIALLALAGVGLATWRWGDVYGVLAARAPAVAAALPPALRPRALYDGEEHEPNDVPARANLLPIPPGADGRAAGGVAVMRGFVGARLSDASGDVDVYRFEIPAVEGTKVLVAEWRGERPGEGISGLDVALALDRERDPGAARTSVTLVATVNRAGPGEPETLVAAIEPGVHYLSVRERHHEATGPVEKPMDAYVLEVRLASADPGGEIAPYDEAAGGKVRYGVAFEARAPEEARTAAEAARAAAKAPQRATKAKAVQPGGGGRVRRRRAGSPEARPRRCSRAPGRSPGEPLRRARR